MTGLDESLRKIFSALDTFLNITLKNETLGKAAEKERSKISALLKKLYSDHEGLDPNPPSSKRKSLVRDSKLESVSSARNSFAYPDFDRPLSTITIIESPEEFAPTTVKALTDPLKMGFLQMKAQGPKQKPYCVLHKNTMYWFSKPSDRQQEGAFSVKDYEFKSDEKKIAKKNFTFELAGPGKKPFQFVADSREDLEAWRKAFDTAHNYTDDGLTYFEEPVENLQQVPRDLPPTPNENEAHYVNEPTNSWDDTPTYVNLEEDEENIYCAIGSS